MYISHEIRTPLSIVNFGLQLIKTQLDQLGSLLEEESTGQEVPGSHVRMVNLKKSRNPSPSSSVDGAVCPRFGLLGGPCPGGGAGGGMKCPGGGGGWAKCPTAAATAAAAAAAAAGGGNEVNVTEETLQQNTRRHAKMKNITRELNSIASDADHSVEVAISILNDLLNYEKLQTNLLEMFKDIVPCALIKTIVNEFNVEADYFKVRLSFKDQISLEDQSSNFIYGDNQKLSQVVRNFVSNALKFTPEGGSVTVTASLQPLEEGKEPATQTAKGGDRYVESGALRVEIRDTG